TFRVTVRCHECGTEVRGNCVRLRKHLLAAIEQSDRARWHVMLPVERREIDEPVFRVRESFHYCLKERVVRLRVRLLVERCHGEVDVRRRTLWIELDRLTECV